MKRVFILALLRLAPAMAGSYNFEVNGGFSAGDEEDYTDENGQLAKRRPFTIETTNLEPVQDFQERDLQAAFDPANANVTDHKVTFDVDNVVSAQTRADVEVLRRNEQGFQFKNVKPRDPSTGGSTMYLPHVNNIYVHETDGESVRAIRLEGWIRKTFIAPLKKELKQSQNAARILGALLGLNMKDLREVLTFERETVAFIESIKSGAIPIYVPGDMFVGESLEVNTNAAADMPSFCDAWSGATASASNAKGTTDWILENVMGFDMDTGTRGEIKIVQVVADGDSASNEKYKRWDNRAAFNTDKGARSAGQDVYRKSDQEYEEVFREKKTFDNIEGVDATIEYDFEKIFSGADLDADNSLTEDQKTAFKAARYNEEIMAEFEKEVDACKRPTT